MSEPEPAQGRHAQEAAATEIDAETASQTTGERGVVKEQANDVEEEIAETELATATPARKGRPRKKNSGEGRVVKEQAIEEIPETEPATETRARLGRPPGSRGKNSLT